MRSLKLYIIQCNDMVKIGLAYEPLSRLKELQIGNPYPLELVLSVVPEDGESPHQAERRAHEAFIDQRIRGEWFFFGHDMHAFIDGIKGGGCLSSGICVLNYTRGQN